MLLVWRVVCWGDWAVNGAFTLVFVKNCRFSFRYHATTQFNTPFTPWNIFPEQSRTHPSFLSTDLHYFFISLIREL